MPREAELSLNERAFILQALKEGIRVDGRAFGAYRDLELSFGEEYGVVDVTLGKTRYYFLLFRLPFQYADDTIGSSPASPPTSPPPSPTENSTAFSP